LTHFEIADLALTERTDTADRPDHCKHGWADLDFGRCDAAHVGCGDPEGTSPHGKRAQRAKYDGKTHHVPPFF